MCVLMCVCVHACVCVCVEDGDKDQFVIEQFYLNEDKKWRFLTVLPKELQLYGVSVALHDNSLYVVGGRTKSGERVDTARVCVTFTAVIGLRWMTCKQNVVSVLLLL